MRDERVSSLCGKWAYEPRRLLFPAPEELDAIVSNCSSERIIWSDLHADPSCHLCQACVIIRLIVRFLHSLLSVFHTLS